MSLNNDVPARPSQARTIALVISLCLNVLLIAVIVVGVTRAVNRAFIAQPGGVLAPGAVMRDLPDDRRAAIRAVQMKHGDAMRHLRRAARRARIDSFRIFAAPHYDAAAFAASLDRVHAADDALENEAIAMVKDVVATLTPQERQTVTDKTRARRPGFRTELQN